MYLIPYFKLFPDQAVEETRTMIFQDHPTVPDGSYPIAEYYCSDPQCDCRRVMLNILPADPEPGVRGFLAAISFGFDRDGEMAGPFLDPLNSQSEYADIFFDIVAQLLGDDPDYVARLERHYDQVKQATSSRTPKLAAQTKSKSKIKAARKRKRKSKKRRKR